MTSSPDTGIPPQEAAADWRRAHPGFIVLQMLAAVRGVALPFVILLVSTGALGDALGDRDFRRLGLFGGGLLAYGLIALLWSVFEWRCFRYALTPQRLLIRSGLISRQERAIPYARIQSVDVVETPVYRIFRLARLRVETASGGSLEGSEVDIKAIGRDEAMRVREQLLRAREVARSDQPAPASGLVIENGELREEEAAADTTTTEGELVRTLSMRELLIAGATSGTIGPAAAVIGGVISQAENLVPEAWWDRVPWGRVQDLATNITLLGILIAIVALIAWIMAILGTVITYYGFELRRTDEHLFVQHGLLDKRRATIPTRRIQAIRLEEGILRQPFGLVTVRYSSAGRGMSEEGGSGTIFPFMPRSGVQALLDQVAPEFSVDVDSARLNPLPKRALRRYVIGDTLVTAIVIAAILLGIWYWRENIAAWWYLLLAIVPFQAMMGWLAYRDAGWRVDGPLLLLRSRSFTRSTLVTTRRRVQHRKITANPLQRRARLATLHVAVAAGLGGGTTSLAHVDRADGERLLIALNPRAGT
jgi:putative membrane protein